MDTIAAISTPLGEGGIGIVRISGDDAIRIVDKIFKGSILPSKAPTHTIHHGKIIDPTNSLSADRQEKQEIDEVLLMIMRAPHTYTREDTVEINTHGGIAVLKKILEVVLASGARLAQRGEFTKRAFLSGRIDLSQAEAVIDIIRAKTEKGVSLAFSQLEGRLKDKTNEIKEMLVEAKSLLELSIDFPEQGKLDSKRVKKLLGQAETKISRLIQNGEAGRMIREGMIFSILGRPNVGKSSLFNALLLEDKAIVTPYPGTTRDIIEGWISVDGVPVKIVDTAGIRDTDNPIEQEGVARTKKALKDSFGVFYVIDKTRGITDKDKEMLKFTEGKKVIGILNKQDLIQNQKPKIKNQKFPMVSISALKMENIDGVIDALRDFVVTSNEVPIVSKERHLDTLKRTKKAIKASSRALAKNLTPEIISYELAFALRSLGEITGEVLPTEILNKIFEDFCIGK